MKQHPLHHSKITTHRFLFNKTDATGAPPETRAGERRHTCCDGHPFDYPDSLEKEFPELLAGDAFIRHAMDVLSRYETFSVLAIQMDNFATTPDTPRKDHVCAVLSHIAEAIDEVCKQTNGCWGLTGRNIFGCFFPEAGDESATTLAEKIKIALAKRCTETVTVGIAPYPMLHFSKEQLFENARKAIDHAAFFGPDSMVSFDAISLNVSGDRLYQEGDIGGACVEFETALLLDPGDVNIHNSLGVCYGVMQKYEKALEEFETAIRLDPAEVMGVYNIGLINMLMGNREEALQRFLEAGVLDENTFEVAFQTGRLYLEMGQPDQASVHLEKAVRLNPDSWISFRCLGECYTALNRMDEAITAYKKAVKLNPNDAPALSAMGHLFDIMGENPEIALTFCRQSVDISPDNGLFRYRLAELYYKQNLLKEALKEFDAAQSLGHDASEYTQKIQDMLYPGGEATNKSYFTDEN